MLPPAEASAISAQFDLRAKASDRLGQRAAALRYTAPGLEMMTHPAVAQRRAKRLASFGLPVADLTCGLGGDLLALLDQGVLAIGVERDPATAVLAAFNTRGSVVLGDALRPPIDLARTAVVLDPARREGQSRRWSREALTPRWDDVLRIAAQAPAAAIKAAPGTPADWIPGDAEVEYVQFGRSMREAAVYLGCGAEPGVRRAVRLPGTATLANTEPASAATAPVIGAFIHDPHSCVTTAGVVQQLAYRMDAARLDEPVAYLTSDRAADDALAESFRVIDTVEFSVARLRRALLRRGLRPVEIRRRAFPVEPDELRRLLRIGDGEPATVLCTTIRGRRLAIICARSAESPR